LASVDFRNFALLVFLSYTIAKNYSSCPTELNLKGLIITKNGKHRYTYKLRVWPTKNVKLCFGVPTLAARYGVR